MNKEERFVEIDNCRILLRRAGSGAPVLFLHGAGGVPFWLPFFDRLAERYDLLVPDHPGYGQSSTPVWLDEVGDVAFFYLDLLKAIDLKGVHVVGHSLGGWIALEMAVRSTQRIKSVTLMAPAGIRISGKPIANIFFMDRVQLARALFADPKLAEQMLAVEPTPEQIDEIVKNNIATARLGWHPRLFNPKLRHWLHRIGVPTHILWGEEDRIVPPVYANELKGLIPGATVTMVPGGHLPQMEALDATTTAVTDFIGRNS